MTYHNILSNATLQCSEQSELNVEVIHELGYPPQYIWHPIQWRTVVKPTIDGQYGKRQHDLHVIPTVSPQVIPGEHRKTLMVEASFKHFVVTLEQRKIPLKAHQRYLVKVYFTPDVNLAGSGEASNLAWRITAYQNSHEYTDGFQNAPTIEEWGQPRSALLVLHSHEAQTVDLWVEFWSKFGNLGDESRIRIHSIELLEVEVDYGDGGMVHEIGTPSTEPPPNPDPDPNPPPLPPDPTPDAPPWLGYVGAGLIGVVLAVLFLAILQGRAWTSSAVMAQGVQPMEGIMNITEAGELLVAMVAAIIAGGAAAPIFTPLVNLVKLILRLVGWEKKVTGQTINAWVAGIIVLLAWFSRHWGVELEAQTVMDWLVIFIPPVIMGISIFTGNRYVYQFAQKINLPLYKYQRTP